MTRVAAFVLFINGVSFAVTGIYALAAPEALADRAQFSLLSVSGYNEFLANYGGMYLAFGVYLAYAATRAPMRRGAWLMLTVACGGLVLGRLVAIIQFGQPGAAQLTFLTWELATATFGLVYLSGKRREA